MQPLGDAILCNAVNLPLVELVSVRPHAVSTMTEVRGHSLGDELCWSAFSP